LHRKSPALCNGDEMTIVVRPEDIELAGCRDELGSYPVGQGVVDELQFVGSTERLRVTVRAGESLHSELRPAASSFLIDAARAAGDAEQLPVSRGQRVWLGCKDFHPLPTPISSLRLLAATHAAREALARLPVVCELSQRMQMVPVHDNGLTTGSPTLRGLAVVSLATTHSLETPLALLKSGARQVLAVPPGAQRATRMYVCTDPSTPARDAALATASSLARHLTLDVAWLLGRGDRSQRAARYKELLDLRKASFFLHGLDIRTEIYAGSMRDAITSRQVSPQQVLLVVGLANPAGNSRLLREVESMLSTSMPAGLLMVAARPERESRIFTTATYVAATAR
jgi:hypothetical protein